MTPPESKRPTTTMELLKRSEEAKVLEQMRQKALLDERFALGETRRKGKEAVAVNLLADYQHRS